VEASPLAARRVAGMMQLFKRERLLTASTAFFLLQGPDPATAIAAKVWPSLLRAR